MFVILFPLRDILQCSVPPCTVTSIHTPGYEYGCEVPGCLGAWMRWISGSILLVLIHYFNPRKAPSAYTPVLRHSTVTLTRSLTLNSRAASILSL